MNTSRSANLSLSLSAVYAEDSEPRNAGRFVMDLNFVRSSSGKFVLTSNLMIMYTWTRQWCRIFLVKTQIV